MNESIEIYVADLAAYNNGKSHGVWIDATQSTEYIQDQINELLAGSPESIAEEYAIHDHEGFAGYPLAEYEGIQRAHGIACFIKEHGEIAGQLLSHFDGSLKDARTAIEENYCGYHASLADYAEELTSDTQEIPEHLANYIDYEKMGRDMELSGDVFTIEMGCWGVHVFWSH